VDPLPEEETKEETESKKKLQDLLG